MKYQHIAAYISNTLWAMTPEKIHELLSVFAFRAAGREFTSEEIQARIGARSSGGSSRQGDSVAVVPIRGVIAHRMSGMDESSGGTSCESIGAMFRQAQADATVGTIVLDIDSPGGTATGIQELAGQLFESRGRGTKRVIAVANGSMGSGAYWLGSQADEIVALPSAQVGSIGVFSVHEDLSKHLAQEGITVSLIKAGKNKFENNPFEPLSDDARAHIQGQVDEAYGQFVKDVARGRRVSQATVKEQYGDGRVFTGKEALKAGLVDAIGTMDSVISSLLGGAPSKGALRAELTGAEAITAAFDKNPEAMRAATDELLIAGSKEADRLLRLRLL
jgi:signal peptide peptidase SppA